MNCERIWDSTAMAYFNYYACILSWRDWEKQRRMLVSLSNHGPSYEPLCQALSPNITVELLAPLLLIHDFWVWFLVELLAPLLLIYDVSGLILCSVVSTHASYAWCFGFDSWLSCWHPCFLFMTFRVGFLVELLAPLLLIYDVSGLILGPETEYPDWSFLNHWVLL
jgi:hypothetical protein